MIKTTLTPEEIRQMIDNATYLRDKVILSFYADTGARCSELLRIKPEHIDFDACVVMIPHLKRGIRKFCPKCGHRAGRNTPFCSKCGTSLAKVEAEGIDERNRLINISEGTRDLLKEYIAAAKPTDTVFNLTRQSIYGIVRKAAESVGLTGRALLNPETTKKHYVHPHIFRDSLAVDWLNFSGGDISKQKALQEHLGHQSFDTTMRYHKLTPSAVRKVSDEVTKIRFGKK